MSGRDVLRSLRSGHWPSLLGAWMHFEISFMVWLLIAALGVAIAEEFGLGATGKGLLVAVPLLGGALLRVPIGAATDRLGAKPVGLALLGCEALALLWGWSGPRSYPEMLAVGLLLGSAGASFAVALPLASRAYPPAHQGIALGVAASANSGTVLAMWLAPRLADALGWRGVFGVMAVPVVATGLLFAWLVPSHLGWVRHGTYADWWATTRLALRQRSMYWLCFLYSVTFGGFVGLSSFLPLFLHDEYGLHPVAAGTVTAVCGLAGSLIRPAGGYVADRLGGLAVFRVVVPAIAALWVGISLLPPPIWAAFLLLATMATLGFGNGVVFQVVSDRFPKHIGVASGMVGAAGGFGGFLLPVWLGSLKDLTGTYATGFLLCGAMALLAWISAEVAWRRRRGEPGSEAAGFSH